MIFTRESLKQEPERRGFQPLLRGPVDVNILNAKNLAPPFLSVFSGSKSMTTKINII